MIENGEIISIIIEIGDLSQAIGLVKCMVRTGNIFPMISMHELKRLLNDYVKPVFNFSCKKDKVVKMEKKVRRNQISNLELFGRTYQTQLLKLSKRLVNRKPWYKSDSAFELIGCNLNDSFP
ncbi:MAG: hypothetical protein PHR83_16495 [Paludibacter sp.]|nr:hypothetical protein [Paludibacter sp.]